MGNTKQKEENLQIIWNIETKYIHMYIVYSIFCQIIFKSSLTIPPKKLEEIKINTKIDGERD